MKTQKITKETAKGSRISKKRKSDDKSTSMPDGIESLHTPSLQSSSTEITPSFQEPNAELAAIMISMSQNQNSPQSSPIIHSSIRPPEQAAFASYIPVPPPGQPSFASYTPVPPPEQAAFASYIPVPPPGQPNVTQYNVQPPQLLELQQQFRNVRQTYHILKQQYLKDYNKKDKVQQNIELTMMLKEALKSKQIILKILNLQLPQQHNADLCALLQINQLPDTKAMHLNTITIYDKLIGLGQRLEHDDIMFLSRAYFALGRDKDASKLLDKATGDNFKKMCEIGITQLQHWQKNTLTQVKNYSVSFRCSQSNDEAAETLVRTSDMVSHNEEGDRFFNLARTHFESKKYKLAFEAMIEAIKIDPKNEHYSLAYGDMIFSYVKILSPISKKSLESLKSALDNYARAGDEGLRGIIKICNWSTNKETLVSKELMSTLDKGIHDNVEKNYALAFEIFNLWKTMEPTSLPYDVLINVENVISKLKQIPNVEKQFVNTSVGSYLPKNGHSQAENIARFLDQNLEFCVKGILELASREYFELEKGLTLRKGLENTKLEGAKTIIIDLVESYMGYIFPLAIKEQYTILNLIEQSSNIFNSSENLSEHFDENVQFAGESST